jgi:hypothetical protein
MELRVRPVLSASKNNCKQSAKSPARRWHRIAYRIGCGHRHGVLATGPGGHAMRKLCAAEQAFAQRRGISKLGS